QLRRLADTMGSGENSGQKQMRIAARDVAHDLTSSKLPPQEKIAELRSLERELDKVQPERQAATKGSGNSSGSGNGTGSSGQGEGQGSGSGSGSGASQGQGSRGGNNTGKANQQIVELHNDIAKAQAKLEQEANSGSRTNANQSNSSGTGASPQPGNNPGQARNQNSTKGGDSVTQPQTVASAKMPSGQNPSARHDERGTTGDTHLGEFPKPGNYQRFYKTGEQGPPIDIRDARYITFQLPTTVEAAGAGTLVTDKTRPNARTPYTNSPLKPSLVPASPDEQQLVPPRYRDLIR
ncbi:MAG TPA: hypothetical protein VJ728_08170, partial [Candidatus Binataceae bacterium]|nr:hypothetical protein [Candidatus Binataceae bacterium]